VGKDTSVQRAACTPPLSRCRTNHSLLNKIVRTSTAGRMSPQLLSRADDAIE
jgi:hypothetical protein